MLDDITLMRTIFISPEEGDAAVIAFIAKWNGTQPGMVDKFKLEYLTAKKRTWLVITFVGDASVVLAPGVLIYLPSPTRVPNCVCVYVCVA